MRAGVRCEVCEKLNETTAWDIYLSSCKEIHSQVWKYISTDQQERKARNEIKNTG